ncbi:MAG TPA: hypothetical protein DEB73_01630 [Candidatus Magasanikbacteria bacterium]|nr:hypothetical protein [Candidatus Magasanikbacteria bacterium]
MLIAKRRATDYQEPAVAEPESAPLEVPAPVVPEVASSTPNEEPTPALTEMPVIDPAPIIELVSPPVETQLSEPVLSPVETPPAPPIE